jgi:signal transduction histidine kinase
MVPESSMLCINVYVPGAYVMPPYLLNYQYKFTKFATKSQTGGTGLGLFICKGIIEAHGYKIWAENNADRKGATFTFTLPIVNGG